MLVLFSCSVRPTSYRPHGLQHAMDHSLVQLRQIMSHACRAIQVRRVMWKF